MPKIFQGRCSACGAVTPTTSGSYSARFVDEPTTSAAAHPDDSQLVVVSSPDAAHKFAETARAEVAAARAGRLVNCEQVFCESCGTMYEIRGLCGDWTMFGWAVLLGYFALAIAGGVGVARLVGLETVWSLVAGASTFVLLLGAVVVGIDWWVRWRHPERAARVATARRCPACGSRWYKHASMLVGAIIRCAKCGKRTMGFYRVRRP